MKKVYIVGCSRSGTTLLQKRIIENSHLWTMPETGWFLTNFNTFYGRAAAVGRLHTAMRGKEIRIKFLRFLLGGFYLINKSGMASFFKILFSRKYAISFLPGFFSEEASRNRYDGWVEKTPLHFRVIDKILDTDQDCKVIFVIRKGEDVVASIYDRYVKNPSFFSEQSSYEYGVNLWNESLTKCVKYLNHNRVKVISYDAYVRDEEKGVNDCLEFLGIERGGNKGIGINYMKDGELWKENVKGEVSIQASKFKKIFSLEEQGNIEKSINKKCYRTIIHEISRDCA